MLVLPIKNYFIFSEIQEITPNREMSDLRYYVQTQANVIVTLLNSSYKPQKTLFSWKLTSNTKSNPNEHHLELIMQCEEQEQISFSMHFDIYCEKDVDDVIKYSKRLLSRLMQ